MKKILLSFAVLATSIAATQAQTFTNASFETWHDYSVNTGLFPPNPISLSAPTGGWSGIDSLIAGATPFAAVGGITLEPQKQLFKSTVAHTGEFSAEVKSEYLGEDLGNFPGMFVNAKVEVDIMAAAAGSIDDILDFVSYTGGTPITAQVDTVKAWISLDSTSSMDNGMIIANAVKMYGDSTAIIGTGTVTVTRGTAAFRQIAVPLTYIDNTVPEKLLVVFMSSDLADSVHVGNSMKVDDATFSYKPGSGVGIHQPLFSESKILVYPNPTNNQIYFNLDASVKPSDFNLAIFDINGRLISKEQLQQAVNSKNVAAWAKGSYFYTLVNDKLSTKEQGKFVVK